MSTKANKLIIAANIAKGDAAIAQDAGKAAREALLSQLNAADDLLGNALLFALKMTAQHGATSAKEVGEFYPRCASPAQYASMFNLGDKVQAIIGVDATLALIDKASEGKGSAFNRAKAILADIVGQAKTAGVKTLNKSATKMAVKAAIVRVEKKAEEKKIAPKVVGVKTPKPAEGPAALAQAALQSGASHREVFAALKLTTQNAKRMGAPEGREAAYHDAMDKLADACEAWSVFAK